MNRRIDEIVKRVIKRALNEEFKTGDSLVIPGDESFGRKVIRNHYKMDPNDFEYIGGGKFVYKVKPKKTRTSTRKPKFKSQDLGRKEGETEQDYLERVRELNKKFADVEKEIEGEQWRPLQNTGRYFGGATDYTRSHEVSNMGRIRTIDFSDPMKSRISTGYDAPTRNARQFHLDTHDEAGEAQKTTPPIHTMVADAWLDAPEGNIEDYDIEHIDGNYHNNSTEWFKDIDTFFYEQVGLWINAHDHKRTTSRGGWSVSPMVKYEVVRFGQMHFNLLLQGTIRSMGVTKYTESYVTPTFPNPGEYRDVNPWDDATTLFSWGVSLRPTIVYEFSTHISAELSLDLLSIGYVNSTTTYTPAEAALDPIKSTTATLYAGLNALTQPLEWEPALVKLGFNYTF